MKAMLRMATACLAIVLLIGASISAAETVPSSEPVATDSSVIEPLANDSPAASRTYSIERAAIGLIGLAILAMILTWAFRNTRGPSASVRGSVNNDERDGNLPTGTTH